MFLPSIPQHLEIRAGKPLLIHVKYCPRNRKYEWSLIGKNYFEEISLGGVGILGLKMNCVAVQRRQNAKNKPCPEFVLVIRNHLGQWCAYNPLWCRNVFEVNKYFPVRKHCLKFCLRKIWSLVYVLDKSILAQSKTNSTKNTPRNAMGILNITHFGLCDWEVVTDYRSWMVSVSSFHFWPCYVRCCGWLYKHTAKSDQ